MTAGVVVANPGHLPWMPRVAARLHELGALEAYYAPVATTERQVRLARERLPFGERIASELRRRQVPAELDGADVRTAAARHELVNVIAQRLRMPDRSVARLADWRDAAFDAAVARRLNGTTSAALVAYAAAQETLASAARLGVRTFLDYPVSHHAFDEALLQEEQRLVPEYAATMQFHRPSDARKRRVEAELAQADLVLAMSSFHRRTFLEEGVSEEKIVVVPPFGVDHDAFAPGELEERTGMRVLFVGQITQRKGISYLVEGFKRASIADAELLLVGRAYGRAEPWRDTLGVHHVDMIAPWETAALYRSADVFVLPAISDAGPRVVLEAMASGLPVIVSENTGTADAVVDGKSGYVIPIRDAGAIAERLLALRGDPDQRRIMALEARRQSLEYPWSRYVDAIVTLVTGRRAAARGPVDA
jgi:glycosyltransferase involved in cell wall biosynthesis